MVTNYEKRGDVAVFEVSGRLDATTSPSFESAVVGKIDGGEHKILIDLDNLEYISSAGLRAMLIVAKKLKQVDGKVALCRLQSQIREVFDIAGFTPLFVICAGVDEGLSQL